MRYQDKDYRIITTRHPETREFIEIVEGEDGYRQAPHKSEVQATFVTRADDIRFEFGDDVPQPVIDAFVGGSMWGWNRPIADPKLHEQRTAK